MSEKKSSSTVWHESNVSREVREATLGQSGATLWLTGLPSSGKSTLAFALESVLVNSGVHAYVLDGDNIRRGLNSDLGFSAVDRTENIRRVGEVAKLFADSGTIVISSFISPYINDRQAARDLHEAAELPFIEIYLNTPVEICESRDPKGLYKKARAGEIPDFTGVGAPYEPPVKSELIFNGKESGPYDGAQEILRYMGAKGIIKQSKADAAISLAADTRWPAS